MRLVSLLCVTLLAFSCESPGVHAGQDKRQQHNYSRIEGSVIASTRARGKVVVLLYEAAHPPPPSGTGRPVTFTVISRELLFQDAADGSVGPFTAPYAFSLVEPGKYVIRAFVDANEDFIPWYAVTADVDRGDVGGGAVDPVTRAARVIDVTLEAPALDVPVSISDSAIVPLDRPIFQAVGGEGSVTVEGHVTTLDVQSQSIVEGVMNQPAPGFLLQLADTNGDGLPDDLNGDTVPDVAWPRLIVRKTSAEAGVLIDENDLDADGKLDEGGLDYEHYPNIPRDGLSDLVVLGAVINPASYMAALLDENGRVRTTPIPVNRLSLLLLPVGFDASTSPPQRLQTVPIGKYAVNFIQVTGQTWRTPNQLSPLFAQREGLPVVASQDFFVQVK